MRNNIIIIALLLFFVKCSQLDQKEKKFIEKHGHENFSEFKGCNLFYRGTNHEEGVFIAGFVPIQQGNYDTICFINLSIKDSTYNLVHDSIYQNIDTIFIISLGEKFLDFEISELQVDTIGNVSVSICEDKTTLFMFVNEEELLKRSKEQKWKQIEKNWYKPQ